MTALADPTSQPMRALANANVIRVKRAALKAEILSGKSTVAGVLADIPPYAASMRISKLLEAQYRWGPERVTTLLGDLRIGDKRLDALSPRHRKAIVTRLTRGPAAPVARPAIVVISTRGALHLVPEGKLYTACGCDANFMRVVPGGRWVSGRRCRICERSAGLVVAS